MRGIVKSVAVLLIAGLAVASAQKLQKAPETRLPDSKGKIVNLADFKGKVVVVNFWATWCPPCRNEIPGFISVYNKQKSKGVEILGVSLDRNGWDVINPFVAKMKIPYPVVLGDGSTADAWGGIEAIPTTFLVDKSGNIVEKHVGYMSEAEFEKWLKKLL